MKKFLTVFMALLVSLGTTVFAACELLETPSDSTTETPSDSTTETPSDSTTETPSDSTTETPSDSTTETPSDSTTETPSDSTTATFESVTVVNNDNLSIIIESYEENYLFGPAFKVYLENKTSNVTLMFSVIDAAVNGIMCDPYFAKEVSSGLKANSYIYFSSLESNGINYIETVEMSIRVYDSNDWLADDYYNEVVTLTVPNNNSGASTFNITSQNGFTEKVLADSNGVLVKAVDFDEDYLFGPRFIIYIENSTDKTLMVTADDVGVNGYSCDPYWATEVWAGKASYSSMYWFDSTLESNNITSINKVTFTLRAYDSDNWLSSDIINVSITLNV